MTVIPRCIDPAGRIRAVVAAAVVALSGLLVPTATAQATTTSTAAGCPAVTVPAYFYAGTQWDTAVSGPAGVPRTLILNPASGPGSAPDPAYVTTVTQARAAGARVVGYVHTSYGARTADVVQAEVQRYREWYGVADIFFDEVASSSAQLPYYATLADGVRREGGYVVLNPGVHPDERYMALGDQVVTFEGTYDTYRLATVPAWTNNYDAHRFTHLVYSATKRQMTNAVSLAGKRRAGNVYVTNDGGTNPWDTLPGYWQDELAALAARC